MYQNAAAQLKSGLLEFQKVADACTKVNCHGECSSLFVKLGEAVGVVERGLLRCQVLERTQLVPKKEEKEPLVDEVKRKTGQEDVFEPVKVVTRTVSVPSHLFNFLFNFLCSNLLEKKFSVILFKSKKENNSKKSTNVNKILLISIY